ncbi:P-loop containing nucleoside triphosphate hydrolase protein [Mucidula mucida]|nr:P-loop containing nucleoside triphosphate hydrolase protein [Mucidula mucida]
MTRGLGTHSQTVHERPPEKPKSEGFRILDLGWQPLDRYDLAHPDIYVVGQENAKKALSVAVYNHYNRVRANHAFHRREADVHAADSNEDPAYQFDTGSVAGSTVQLASVRPINRRPSSQQAFIPSRPVPLFEKSNVLVIGPTGSGKTLLARTLANVLDVPFSSGYVGEDVDMAIQRLLQDAQYDPVRASMGIVYIDEVDKLSRKSGSGTEGSRDVSGEGVQQALLRMMEGSIVSVQVKGGGEVHSAPANGQGGPVINPAPAKNDIYHIDTSNVLFIFSGAFVGLDKIVKQRISKNSIGFASGNGPLFFTPNRKEPSNVLDLVETPDLIQFGFIPEFISRLPSKTALAPLTIPDLRRILTEVKGSLMSQYQSLFSYSGVEMKFTGMAIDEVCRKAEQKGGGARGLRGIMETVLLDAMYETPGSTVKHVLITEDVVKGTSKALYWRGDEKIRFMQAYIMAEDEYARDRHFFKKS